MTVDPHRVRAAHGDAWQAEGLTRASFGGGAAEVRGARLMASGLPFAQWNNADVTDPHPDVDGLRGWYEARDVPWGVRVPVEFELDLGTPIFVKRCFGLHRWMLSPAPPVEGVGIRQAGPGDLAAFIAAESALFGDPADVSAAWISPVFGRDGFGHWMAERDGEVAAVATAVRTDERAGPAIMLTGLIGAEDLVHGLAHTVLDAALSSHQDVLAHAHAGPDDDIALFTALGFVEVPGFQIRVVRGS